MRSTSSVALTPSSVTGSGRYAVANKDQALAKFVAESHGDGLQHFLQLALYRHPNLSFNRSAAKLASRWWPRRTASMRAR